MNSRWLLAGLALAVTSSQAADGLAAPQPDSLWPQWQARVQLQTAPLLPFGEAVSQQIKGGAVLGDYVLVQPSFGVLRATGGIVVGSLVGVPLYKALPGQTPGLFPQGNGLQPRQFDRVNFTGNPDGSLEITAVAAGAASSMKLTMKETDEKRNHRQRNHTPHQ